MSNRWLAVFLLFTTACAYRPLPNIQGVRATSARHQDILNKMVTPGINTHRFYIRFTSSSRTEIVARYTTGVVATQKGRPLRRFDIELPGAESLDTLQNIVEQLLRNHGESIAFSGISWDELFITTAPRTQERSYYQIKIIADGCKSQSRNHKSCSVLISAHKVLIQQPNKHRFITDIVTTSIETESARYILTRAICSVLSKESTGPERCDLAIGQF